MLFLKFPSAHHEPALHHPPNPPRPPANRAASDPLVRVFDRHPGIVAAAQDEGDRKFFARRDRLSETAGRSQAPTEGPLADGEPPAKGGEGEKFNFQIFSAVSF